MRHAIAVVLALVPLACAGGTRTGSAATSGDASVKGLIGASVRVTFAAAVGALTEIPLEPKVVDEATGLVETEYFDLTPHRWEAERYPPVERVVRLVITVAPDTLGRGARVAVRTLYQPALGDYVRGRATERLVPRDHPGVTFAQEVLDRIERRAMGRGR
ncbi:MAG TPA: hypothetical protein VD707_05325 [Gemmatimonadales bacterium]|nr:hypothetical protein [Gemmatimonadales bacterium]